MFHLTSRIPLKAALTSMSKIHLKNTLVHKNAHHIDDGNIRSLVYKNEIFEIFCLLRNILLNTGGEHDGKNTYPMCSPPMHRDIWQHQGVCKDPRDKDRNTWHTWEVRIPPHLHCKHCILQVTTFLYKQTVYILLNLH